MQSHSGACSGQQPRGYSVPTAHLQTTRGASVAWAGARCRRRRRQMPGRCPDRTPPRCPPQTRRSSLRWWEEEAVEDGQLSSPLTRQYSTPERRHLLAHPVQALESAVLSKDGELHPHPPLITSNIISSRPLMVAAACRAAFRPCGTAGRKSGRHAGNNVGRQVEGLTGVEAPALGGASSECPLPTRATPHTPKAPLPTSSNPAPGSHPLKRGGGLAQHRRRDGCHGIAADGGQRLAQQRARDLAVVQRQLSQALAGRVLRAHGWVGAGGRPRRAGCRA